MSAHKATIGPKPLTEEQVRRAPWMKVALGELGKGIHEIPGGKNFEAEHFRALSENNPRYSLLDWNKINRQFAKRLTGIDGMQMEVENIEVSKYLASTTIDKHTKVDTKKDGGHEWRMQAWCAAFVNWCLLQSGVKPLGSARAADWLKFGTPVEDPDPGAVAILKPSPQWEVKGGSGHAAFFGGYEGDKVWILGGNQSRRVSWISKPSDRIVGFRWPKEA
jgi:uncharacterized protein (TIGR02594 family)